MSINLSSLMYINIYINIGCGVGVKSVRVVIMIGRWSEGVCLLFALWYFLLALDSRKLCLERMYGIVPGVGNECIVWCCLGWTCC